MCISGLHNKPELCIVLYNLFSVACRHKMCQLLMLLQFCAHSWRLITVIFMLAMRMSVFEGHLSMTANWPDVCFYLERLTSALRRRGAGTYGVLQELVKVQKHFFWPEGKAQRVWKSMTHSFSCTVSVTLSLRFLWLWARQRIFFSPDVSKHQQHNF